MGIFEKFKLGFKKSASTFTSGLKEIIIKKEIDDKALNEIEDFLIQSDVGVAASEEIRNIIAEKKIDPNKMINSQTLLDLGIVKTLKSKIKLLAKGEIKTKINIEVDAASVSAKDFVEKLGGSITINENKKLALKLSKKAGV